MPGIETDFGRLLRQYRLRAGLSQAALAERARMATSAVAALERGARRTPHPETLRALAVALALSLDERTLLASAARPPRMTPTHTPPTLDGPASNLPALRTALIGRARELAQVCELVGSPQSGARLVTLTGVGGVGTTSLALHVAHTVSDAFASNVWLVKLAQVTSAGLVDRVVADALGAHEISGQAPIEALHARLASRRVLLVLDNCEHVLGACVQLVEGLLDACPGLRVLTTSREPLLLVGEQQVRLSPLALLAPQLQADPPLETAASPAVQLFVARAQGVTPEFALSAANRPTVEAICARLDGLPLALELAAARVRILTLDQIVARLDDCLGLLVGNAHAGLTRHQTLRSAMEWSYALLSPAEATAFRRLSIFVGDFDVGAAETVCADDDLAPEHVLDILTGLIDKSLLSVSSSVGHVARYRFLEPVRQYASSRLRGTQEEVETRGRHAAAYLGLAERASNELVGANQAIWLQRLEADLPQLRSAFQWLHQCADARQLVRLVLAMRPFWEVRGHLTEGREWCEVACRIAQLTADRVQVLFALGRLVFFQVDLDTSTAAFEQARALAVEAGDERTAARLGTWLGAVARRQGDFARARRVLQRNLLEHERRQDAEAVAFAVYNLGCIENRLHGTEASVRLVEDARRRYQALGDVRFAAMTSIQLAADLIDIGRPERAPQLVKEALESLQGIGDRVLITSGLVTLGHAAARMRQPSRAARLLGAAEGLSDSLGQPLPPTLRADYDQVMRHVRAQLPSAAAEVTAGRHLSLTDAIVEAHAMVAQSEPHAKRPRAAVEALTPRERQVIGLVERGLSDSQVAVELGISPRSASVHVRNVLAKLNLRSRWQVRDWAAAQSVAT